MAKAKRRTTKTARRRAKAARRAKRTAGGTGRAVRATRPAGAGPLRGALTSLSKARDELIRQRTQIDQQITAIEGALAAMGGVTAAARPAGPGRGRRRTGSLKEYILKVLSAAGGPMTVKDITQAVLEAGYQTSNKTLAKSVGIALTQIPEVVKVSRGTFKLK